MSAAFYLTYRGKPIRFVGPRSIEEVPAVEATQFVSEADAWWKAYQTDLAPQHVHVHPAREIFGAGNVRQGNPDLSPSVAVHSPTATPEGA